MDERSDRSSALAERLFRDAAGALELYTVYLGERLGLYRALDEGGPATSSELAERTGTTERYVREWLEHHASSGILDVDDPAAAPLERRYRLPAAHVPVLTRRRGWPTPAAVPAGPASAWPSPTRRSRWTASTWTPR